MPTPLNVLGAAAFKGILYAISGQTSSGASTNIVQAYHPKTNTWTTETPIPTARYLAKPQALGGVIYVAGAGANNTAITTVEGLTP